MNSKIDIQTYTWKNAQEDEVVGPLEFLLSIQGHQLLEKLVAVGVGQW